jgi:hypothetical protein
MTNSVVTPSIDINVLLKPIHDKTDEELMQSLDYVIEKSDPRTATPTTIEYVFSHQAEGVKRGLIKPSYYSE